MHHETKIKTSVYLIIVCLLALFSYVFVEHTIQRENRQADLEDRAEYHLGTIFHLDAIKSEIFEVRARLINSNLASRPLSDDSATQAVFPHAQRTTGILEKKLAAMLALQRGSEHAELNAAVERVREKVQNLVDGLQPADSSQHSAGPSLSLLLGQLDLPIEQLTKLHWDLYNRESTSQAIAAERTIRTTLLVDGVAAAVVAFLVYLLLTQVSKVLKDLRTTDAKLKNLNAELENLVAERTVELRAAQQDLIRKERLAAVGQVTATVSHELRNPLGAVRSATDAIRKFADDQDTRMARAIALLDRSQIRCDRIIEDLLNFTRVRELNRESTDIDRWLGAVIEDCGVPPNFSLSQSLASGIELPVDRERLRRAVVNAVENARHAMEEADQNDGGTRTNELAIAARTAKGRLEISVGDTGPGIPDEFMPNVFEPLYSTKVIGTGLGLPLIRQTMEQHGGGAEIFSNPGLGTEIVLWLPIPGPEKGQINETA